MVHLCDGILNHAGKSNCFTLLHAATYYLKMIVAVHVCQRWFHFSCCWPKLCVVAHSLTLYKTGFDSMQRKHFTSAHHSHDSHVSYCKKCKEGKKNAKSEKPSAHTVHIHSYTSMTLFFRVIQLHRALSIDPIIKLTTLLLLIFSFHFATYWR